MILPNMPKFINNSVVTILSEHLVQGAATEVSCEPVVFSPPPEVIF